METSQAESAISQRAACAGGSRKTGSGRLLKRIAVASAIGLLTGVVVIPKPIVIGSVVIQEKRVAEGAMSHATLRVFNAGLLPLELWGPSSSHCAACSEDVPTRFPCQRVLPLTVKSMTFQMHMVGRAGHVAEHVHIASNCPVRRILSVPYLVDVYGLAAINPTAIDLKTPSGAGAEGCVAISNVNDEALELRTALLDVNPGLSFRVTGVPATLPPGHTRQIQVRIAGASAAGTYGGNLAVVVEGRDDPYLIPFTATITAHVHTDRNVVVIDDGDAATTCQRIRLVAPNGSNAELLKCQTSSRDLRVTVLPDEPAPAVLVTYDGSCPTGALSITTAEVTLEVRLGRDTCFLRVPVFMLSLAHASG